MSKAERLRGLAREARKRANAADEKEADTLRMLAEAYEREADKLDREAPPPRR